MIRVLLVDDQPLIRSGFRALLDLEDDIEVVAEAANGQEGLELATENLPDIALIDIQMPVLDGIETTRRIAADPALAGVHVVILTNYGLDEYVFNALRAGAAGFLVKDIVPEDFLHAVRVAARGDALLAPSITRKLINRYVTQPPPTATNTALEGLDQPRTRGRCPGRAGPFQRRDRGPYGDQPTDREDPCQPGHDQTPGPRPRPARGPRLRIRPGDTAQLLTPSNGYVKVAQ